MTRAALQALADRYLDAWQRHDVAAIAACHAPDGLVESPMFATLRGRPALGEAHRTLFTAFPDGQHTAHDIVIDPPRIAIFTTFRATQANPTQMNEVFGLPGAHRKTEGDFVMVLTVEDGLIVRDRRIYDFTGMLVQTGALRAKPGKP